MQILIKIGLCKKIPLNSNSFSPKLERFGAKRLTLRWMGHAIEFQRDA